MAAEVKKEIQLEIAHVLFIDIVGYSKLSINDQRAAIDELTQVVRASEQFQNAEAAARLLKIPTGDGMTLVFYKSPEEPVQCALEISCAFKEHAKIQRRMGVHSGPVSGVIDVNGQANLAGAGLNMAQRVMGCGDAGHILLSKRVADDLGEYEHWRPFLHDLGECEVKHGMRVSIVNLHADEVGNPAVPGKFRRARAARIAKLWKIAAGIMVIILLVAGGLYYQSRESKLLTDKDTIVLADFTNSTGDPVFDGTLRQGLAAQLEQSPFLSLISDQRIAQALALMSQPKDARLTPELAREVGQRTDSGATIEGSISTLGSQYVLGLKAVNCRSGDLVAQEQVTANGKD